jgi:D-3-phosphoglycerate dehydrogenase
MVVRSETKVTRKVIEAASKLRVVGRAGVGVDNVDVEAATQRGVVVMNTPGGNTVSTAELSFAMILALARRVPQAHASMAEGKWDRKQFQGAEVSEKTLGVLGMGRIGSEVARRALAFGMKVIGYDPFLTEARAKSLGVEVAADLDDVYQRADFITVHMPVTELTRGMLNASAFAKMKPGMRLVNCARGEIIVENDLIAALNSGNVAAAALDVFSTEPLPSDHPFRKHPGIMLTPHLGASTVEAQEKCGVEVAEVITSYLLTGEVRNAVNLPFLDAKTYEEVKPYLTLGEKLGRLLAQLAPPQVDRLHITYGGKARELPNIDPVTRAVLQGFLSRASVKELNNVNVRNIASTLGLTVEEKRSNEPVTFNEWLHVQAFNGSEKKISAGGTFFGSPNNPRIVRLYSTPVEIPISGTLLLLTNKDRPGIVGYLGTLMSKHKINIASMSLSRDTAGGHALTVLNLDSVPPAAVLDEIQRDPDISNVKVVQL